MIAYVQDQDIFQMLLDAGADVDKAFRPDVCFFFSNDRSFC